MESDGLQELDEWAHGQIGDLPSLSQLVTFCAISEMPGILFKADEQS